MNKLETIARSSFPVLALVVSFAAAVLGQAQSNEKELIKPTRPTIANPAEFQAPGVLQAELGYDGFYRSSVFRSQHSSPFTLRYAAHERLLLQLDFDAFISEKDQTGERETGVGDVRVGLQVVAAKESENRPGVAFAYDVKLPNASHEKGLGTGRTDHRLTFLLSKKFGKTDIDFNAAYLNIGRELLDRRAHGAQAALEVSYEFENDFGLTGELSGQTEDYIQPKGAYALGAITYKVNERLRFDTGLRFGLTPDSPRYGFFGGFTLGAGHPFSR